MVKISEIAKINPWEQDPGSSLGRTRSTPSLNKEQRGRARVINRNENHKSSQPHSPLTVQWSSCPCAGRVTVIRLCPLFEATPRPRHQGNRDHVDVSVTVPWFSFVLGFWGTGHDGHVSPTSRIAIERLASFCEQYNEVKVMEMLPKPKFFSNPKSFYEACLKLLLPPLNKTKHSELENCLCSQMFWEEWMPCFVSESEEEKRGYRAGQPAPPLSPPVSRLCEILFRGIFCMKSC